MRKFYSIGLNKDQIKYLNITKQQLMGLFTNPRMKKTPLVTKGHICMDWCNIHPFKDNYMDTWFMVFDKAPSNNGEVPLYFLTKLWEEFVMGQHVNNFYIFEF